MNTPLSQTFNSVLLEQETENLKFDRNNSFYFYYIKDDNEFYIYQKSLIFKQINNESFNFDKNTFIIEKSETTPLEVKQFKKYFRPYINFNTFNNSDYDFIKKFIYLLIKSFLVPLKSFKTISNENLEPDNYFNY